MKNDNVKLNLLRLKSLILQNKYNKRINIECNNNDIIFLMNKNIENLKLIDKIYTLADIESIRYGNTSYPDNLYINKLITFLCFFNIFIGFIDGNIDYLKNIQNEEVDDVILNYKKIKNKIIRDCKSSTNNNFFIVNRSFNTNINSLINLDNINKLEVLKSYITGYINYNKYSLYDIYIEYSKLLNEFNDYIYTNRNNFEKVKKKVK